MTRFMHLPDTALTSGCARAETAHRESAGRNPRRALLSAALMMGALLPLSASAQWTEVTKARNGDVWLMDSGTAKRIGDSARVWVLINHPQPVTNPAPYALSGVRSLRALVQIDCKDQRARKLEASYFSQSGSDGRLLGTSDGDDWFNVPPDTPDSDLLKLACELPDQAPTAPAAPASPAPAAAAPAAPRPAAGR